MRTPVVFLIILLALSACGMQPEDGEALHMPLANVTATIAAQTDATIAEFTVADIRIALPCPPKWETYTTQYGVVLAEYLGSVATHGQLGGVLVHVFVPPLDGVDLPVSQTNNHALHILRQILSHPDYVGNATVSQPIPFVWDELDAAYYLMDNGEGNLTIVIGIYHEDSSNLVTVSVSAPTDEEARIRKKLPMLLDNLVFNERMLSGASLDAILPNPLVFPRHQP